MRFLTGAGRTGEIAAPPAGETPARRRHVDVTIIEDK
jgi:hypothetical protein